MKAAVLHINTASATATSPTMRIARFVAEELRIPLIHDKHSALEHDKKFDVLFCKYGMLKFSDQREEALRIHQRAGHVINLENDYTFKPDPRFKPVGKQTTGCWSTVTQGLNVYVNWNVLTWMQPDAWKKPLPLLEPEEEGVLYYGAHRAGREPYFRRYFKDAPYDVTISTYRGRAAFTETCGEDVRIIGAFRTPAQATRFPLTVYMEDQASHDLYCSPANRFYECLQLGIAQAIDERAAATLKKAGLKDVDKFVVSTQNEVGKMLVNFDKVRKEQRRLWHCDFTAELRAQLQSAYRSLT